MARYLQVSSDIAERVAAGRLAPGEELPSIRQAAQRYDTTATTIARAWRHLADAGVIEIPDRARARVAAAGEAAARRLLGGQPALRLAGSDDPGLDIALRHTGTAVTTVGARGSFHGLTRIWRGTADAAAIHLQHRSGDGNHPFARSLLRGRQPAIIHLWRREQGLLIPPDNPGHVTGPASLRGLRIARRPFGTGTRVLLDELLADAGIPPASVTGPDAASHLEVAMAVAAGQADAGLGVRAAATALDLGFIPLTWEDFDIVLGGDALPAAESLITALRDPRVQASVTSLGGYDLTRAGSVQLLGLSAAQTTAAASAPIRYTASTVPLPRGGLAGLAGPGEVARADELIPDLIDGYIVPVKGGEVGHRSAGLGSARHPEWQVQHFRSDSQLAEPSGVRRTDAEREPRSGFLGSEPLSRPGTRLSPDEVTTAFRDTGLFAAGASDEPFERREILYGHHAGRMVAAGLTRNRRCPPLLTRSWSRTEVRVGGLFLGARLTPQPLAHRLSYFRVKRGRRAPDELADCFESVHDLLRIHVQLSRQFIHANFRHTVISQLKPLS